MTIDQQTISELLQVGGQYFIPLAALLRALYSGWRGKYPEGFTQISFASIVAGFTAATDSGTPTFDLSAVIGTLLGNTAFMAALLSFIMLYLLRQPNRGLVVDGVVGAVIGAISWVIWVYALNNEWPWWTAPLVVAAGAGGFIALRFALRQIARVVRIATYCLVIGGLLLLGGGGIWLYQQITQRAVGT
jgi:hypothetical protein